jgi:flagellum-specific ATP synthase
MSQTEFDAQKYLSALSVTKVTKDIGKITQVTGFTLKGFLPGACVGSVCAVYPSGLKSSFFAEVVGFQDRQIVLMPLGEMRGVGLGSKIELLRLRATVPTGMELLGRVVDGLGKAIDGKGDLNVSGDRPLYNDITNPLFRPPIDTPLSLGVRAIDGLLTIGQGQRVGIMAGSGVGKSVLLGMIARNTSADINVIALIGERGREVREFMEQNLGPEGLKKSVVIVATPDQSPLLRMRAAFFATTIAEYFCEQGRNVLLMMDSLTRFGMAQREIGLSTGEPPAQKGYTPSVFSLLPKLLERAGRFENCGSITGLYTVLVEGDDMDDPIADSVRSIVDGHIVLSRSMAQRGHFPAIDVLQSTSRVMRHIISKEHQALALALRENLAIYGEAEDLINIGAYKAGSNAKIDRAVDVHESIDGFLRQGELETSAPLQTLKLMQRILGG